MPTPPPHPQDQRPNTAARSGDGAPSVTAELNSQVDSDVINMNPPLVAAILGCPGRASRGPTWDPEVKLQPWKPAG